MEGGGEEKSEGGEGEEKSEGVGGIEPRITNIKDPFT